MNTKKSSLKDRLNEALVLREKKAAELTKDLNIPKSAISQYLSGKSQNMDADRLEKIAKYLDVSEPWLMGFDVPRETEENITVQHSYEPGDSLAKRLQRALEHAGMTQTQLAEATGITKGSISRYLSGKFEPKQRAVEELARALNVSIDYLTGKSPDIAPVVSTTILVTDNAGLQESSISSKKDPLQLYKDQVFDILLRLHTDPQFWEIVAKVSTLDKDKLQAMQQFLKAFGE